MLCHRLWWHRILACVQPSRHAGMFGHNNEQICIGRTSGAYLVCGNSCGKSAPRDCRERVETQRKDDLAHISHIEDTLRFLSCFHACIFISLKAVLQMSVGGQSMFPFRSEHKQNNSNLTFPSHIPYQQVKFRDVLWVGLQIILSHKSVLPVVTAIKL